MLYGQEKLRIRKQRVQKMSLAEMGMLKMDE